MSFLFVFLGAVALGALDPPLARWLAVGLCFDLLLALYIHGEYYGEVDEPLKIP